MIKGKTGPLERTKPTKLQKGYEFEAKKIKQNKEGEEKETQLVGKKKGGEKHNGQEG